MNKIIVLFVIILSLLISGCSENSVIETSCVINNSKISERPAYNFSEVEKKIEGYIDDNLNAEEASIVIVHKDYGTIYEKAFGLHEPGSTFILASTSKVPAVMVALSLEDEGLIDFDTPIADYVDWDESAGWNDDFRLGITMRHLLSNHSGLPGLFPFVNEYNCEFDSEDALLSCAEHIYTTDPIGADINIIEPGTEFRYGGGQWQLAGGVAEYVSGNSWKMLVKEKLAKPGKLNVFEFGSLDRATISSYPSDRDSPETLIGKQNPTIEGGGLSNTHDYANILLINLNDGMCGSKRVLTKKSIESMRSNNSNIGDPPYGMGWWIETNSAGETLYVDPGAYGAISWLDLKRGIGVFFALETGAGDGEELMNIIEPVIREAVDSAR